jgi:membrane-associated phospholipid phosphatase
MPLYGGGLPDGLACGLLLAISAVDGVGRLVADKHYASDVITGALVGSAIGYLTPTLLHYRYPVEKLGGFMVLPSFSPTFAGLAATSVM